LHSRDLDGHRSFPGGSRRHHRDFARRGKRIAHVRQEYKGCGFKPSNAAVLYEDGTNTYAFTGGMNSARVFDSAVRLPNGQVLVSGGTNTISSGATLASAELYMP